MSKEIMQEALDALINSRDTVWNVYQTDWRHGLPTRLSQMFAMEKECKDHDAAIAAIEAELAKPEQPQTDLRKAAEMALHGLLDAHEVMIAEYSDKNAYADEIEGLRQALTQPEPNSCPRCGKRLGDGIHTCTPSEQEPVAWIQDSIELYVNDRPTSIYTIPLYTKPPKREWQGLTDDDLDKCDAHETWRSMRNVAQMLKEKNT